MEILSDYGKARTISFPLITKGASDFTTGGTFVAGDVQISKDGGAFANTTNLPTHEGNGIYSLTLTATEMQAGYVAVTIKDQTNPKVWEDQALLIYLGGTTYQAKAWLTDDDAASKDRYLICWYRNGVQISIPGEVTSPTLQVIKTDGTDLIAATGMTQVSGIASWMYEAISSARITDGQVYLMKVTATIDGATRTWLQPFGRDI